MNICGQIQGKSIELDLIKNLSVLLQLDTIWIILVTVLWVQDLCNKN